MVPFGLMCSLTIIHSVIVIKLIVNPGGATDKTNLRARFMLVTLSEPLYITSVVSLGWLSSPPPPQYHLLQMCIQEPVQAQVIFYCQFPSSTICYNFNFLSSSRTNDTSGQLMLLCIGQVISNNLWRSFNFTVQFPSSLFLAPHVPFLDFMFCSLAACFMLVIAMINPFILSLSRGVSA